MDSSLTVYQVIIWDLCLVVEYIWGSLVVVVSQFNGTSIPKGSYSAKTGDNDCKLNSSRCSLRTALCETKSLSCQVWTKCPTRPDTRGSLDLVVFKVIGVFPCTCDFSEETIFKRQLLLQLWLFFNQPISWVPCDSPHTSKYLLTFWNFK